MIQLYMYNTLVTAPTQVASHVPRPRLLRHELDHRPTRIPNPTTRLIQQRFRRDPPCTYYLDDQLKVDRHLSMTPVR